MELFDALARGEWRLPTADGSGYVTLAELGEGNPVVVLSGGPGNHFGYMVDAVRRSLDAARWVLLEQRGSLLSPFPTNALTVGQLLEDVESLRGALGEERLVLFGHSFGSLLAELYYLAHPDRVRALILSGSFPPACALDEFGHAMQQRQGRLMGRPDVAQAIRAAGIDPAATDLPPRQRYIRTVITGQASFAVWDLARWPLVRDCRWNRAAANAIGNSLPASYDIAQTWAENPVPITVLQGEYDYVDPAASIWQDFGQERQQVHVEMIPAAVHNPWLDHPAQFDAALRQALRRR